MDVGIWGGRLRGQLFKYIEDVLEGNRDLLTDPAKPPQSLFEVSTQFSQLQTLIRTWKKTKSKDFCALFSQFSPYFEVGFFLQGTEEQSVLKAMFLFGKNFSQDEESEQPLKLKLPRVSHAQVHRANGGRVLCEFGLESLTNLLGSQAYLFRVTDDKIFLFILDRPHPWALFHIEQIFEALCLAKDWKG